MTEEGLASQALCSLTSGRQRTVRGGAFQAHICAIKSAFEATQVLQRLQQAAQFRAVVNWSYAWRLPGANKASGPTDRPMETSEAEGVDDGIDEGSGERILGVLRRFALEGMLVAVSRWEDVGASCGIEELGTELYSIVVERCKDLIVNLQNVLKQAQSTAMHRGDEKGQRIKKGRYVFNFGSLPKPPEPRLPPGKYGPNHFRCEMERSQSLPRLLGGDPKHWQAHDVHLQDLPPEELWALRSLRKPHRDVLRVFEAVALLKGQWYPGEHAGNAVAQWARCREMLLQATFRTELVLLNVAKIPEENARCARALLEGLEPDNTRRLGAGITALLSWARHVIRCRSDGTPQERLESAPSRLTSSQGVRKVRRPRSSGQSQSGALHGTAMRVREELAS